MWRNRAETETEAEAEAEMQQPKEITAISTLMNLSLQTEGLPLKEEDLAAQRLRLDLLPLHLFKGIL